MRVKAQPLSRRTRSDRLAFEFYAGGEQQAACRQISRDGKALCPEQPISQSACGPAPISRSSSIIITDAPLAPR
jgi:hypothetical protein